MQRIQPRRVVGTAVGVAAVCLVSMITLEARGAAKTPLAPSTAPKLPPFAEIQAAVNQHFASIKRNPLDLISQGDVNPVFAKLDQIGWRVPDQTTIVQQVLPDKSFLVTTLRTRDGKDFARRISQYPDGYDRVDRLSRLPHGHTFLQGLIPGPDGWKMVEYMTQTSGGQVLGQQVENAPLGKKFNDATGRIYTSEQLVKRLRLSYNTQLGIETVAEPVPSKKQKRWPRTHVNVVLPD